MKGFFKCKNPNKYKGDVSNIVYRSSWELLVMRKLDDHPDVTWWQSEEFFIPYMSPVDNKIHRYYVDFRCKIKNKNNEEKIYIIEVKPKHQTIAPIKPKKINKSFINETLTWGVNQAKWESAKKYCLNNGYEFTLITEDDIFGKNSLKYF